MTKDTKQEFLEGLIKVQSEIGALHKSEKNPFHKSNYVPLKSILSEIKPILNNSKFLLTQLITTSEGGQEILETSITHINGECLTSHAPLNVSDKSNPQKYGSVLTYMRRYSLTALLGIEEGDDDGQAAIKPAPPAKIIEKISTDQVQELQLLISKANKSAEDICKVLMIAALSELPKSKFENVVNKLNLSINENN